jgi:Sec-independent protein translocase protein TatA
MRSLGTGIVEFKKGVKGIEDVEASAPKQDAKADDAPAAKT